jgi:23S rRNA pseudouridine2604 synthase
MATLKLPRKTPRPSTDPAQPRAPVRGRAAPRKRPTLAQAQAERAEQAERSKQPERTARNRPAAPPPPRQRQREQPPECPPARGRKPAMPATDAGAGPARGSAGRSRRPGGSDHATRGPGAHRHSEEALGGGATRRRGTPAAEQQRDRKPPQDRPRSTARRVDANRPPAPGAASRRPDAPAGQDRPRRLPPATGRAPAAAVPTSTPAEGERLSKRMTALGLASRREADEWIEAGWVRVDGRVAVLGQRVRPQVHIEIDPRAHGQQAQRVTILLHKPVGYVSGQAEDGYENAASLVRPENQWSGDRSGTRFHRGHLRGLAPAGRLDIDSTGLLVLTQDGRVARLLIGDESRIEKEYLVRVQSVHPAGLDEAGLELLRHGLELDGKPLRPAKVSWQNEDQLRFVLREGRKRQIRRMCEAVGLKVLGLKRVRIGSVVLGQLPAGQWRYLQPHERFA